MLQVLNGLLNVHQYKSSVDRDRAYMAYGITLLMASLYTLYIFFVPTGVAVQRTFIQSAQQGTNAGFYIISFYLAVIITLVAARMGKLEVASWGPVLMWFTGACLSNIEIGFVNAISGIVLLALVLLSALMKGKTGLKVGTGAALVGLLIGIMHRPNLTVDRLPAYITNPEAVVRNSIPDLMTISLLIIGAAGLIALFLRYATVNRAQGVSEAIEDRVLTAAILTQIAQQVAQRAPLQVLLPEIVNTINQKFDFVYHVQVFLISENGRDARLVASTGTIGERLLAEGHSLSVGSVSVIGQVTLTGIPVVARSDTIGTVHRRNILLQETAVEAAFPLRVGDRIIGALDVQSKDANAFQEEHLISTFQALADSITLAIDNVRQFESAQERLKENTYLIEEARKALREVEHLNERLTGRAWSEYLRSRNGEVGLDVDFAADYVQQASDWTTSLQEAMRINHLVQEHQSHRQVIAMPLRVRGRVIGAIEFELDENYNFSPEDLDLVQEVGERFGLAVENARLVDESQRVAQREALVNQITTRLQTTNNVEAMLTEAAQSLKNALKANKVAIRLGAPPRQ